MSHIFTSWNQLEAWLRQVDEARRGRREFDSCTAGARYHTGITAAMAWTVETLNKSVDTELAELPADMRA